MDNWQPCPSNRCLNVIVTKDMLFIESIRIKCKTHAIHCHKQTHRRGRYMFISLLSLNIEVNIPELIIKH